MKELPNIGEKVQVITPDHYYTTCKGVVLAHFCGMAVCAVVDPSGSTTVFDAFNPGELTEQDPARDRQVDVLNSAMGGGMRSIAEKLYDAGARIS